MPPRDHAARAANDDTIGPDDFVARDAGEVVTDEQEHPGFADVGEPILMTPQADGTASGEITADTVVITDEEAETLREENATLTHALKLLRAELDNFKFRRDKEQELLSERDAALHAIESAKNNVAAEKQNLAKVEEEIAKLLRSPMPVLWKDTPIGQFVSSAPEHQAPALPEAVTAEAPPPWQDVLPAVDPSMVRLVENESDLPSLESLEALVCMASIMEGEKRKPPTVMLFNRPYVVTAGWNRPPWDAQPGESIPTRYNCVPLFTKEEWAQLYEDAYGRAVADFDQSDEAKARRKNGGPWCGLVVKIGRSTHVVGPQEAGMHLVYETTAPAADDAPEDDDTDDEDESGDD